MRKGQQVQYQADANKPKTVPATIAAVVGSGASGFKTVDLTLEGGKALTQVPHVRDRVDGAGFWLLPTEPAFTPEEKKAPPRRPRSTAVEASPPEASASE